MPNLFTIMGYKVFFWSNESGEPIHVHISKGQPNKNATKIWLTRSGGCILANNNGNIPKKDLNKLSTYAKKMRVSNVLHQYLEVLL